jgi:hypothetical protein
MRAKCTWAKQTFFVMAFLVCTSVTQTHSFTNRAHHSPMYPSFVSTPPNVCFWFFSHRFSLTLSRTISFICLVTCLSKHIHTDTRVISSTRAKTSSLSLSLLMFLTLPVNHLRILFSEYFSVNLPLLFRRKIAWQRRCQVCCARRSEA